MQSGKSYGMQLLDDDIESLVNKGVVDLKDAYMKAHDKARFKGYLKGEM